jgi:hypothetical protein
LLITRFHDPALWWTGLAVHILYCAGMSAGIAALAMRPREGALMLALQLLPGMCKAWSRTRLACAAMPEQRAWFRRYGWANMLLSPLVTWLWLVTLLTSAIGSEIDWRGRRYRLR